MLSFDASAGKCASQSRGGLSRAELNARGLVATALVGTRTLPVALVLRTRVRHGLSGAQRASQGTRTESSGRLPWSTEPNSLSTPAITLLILLFCTGESVVVSTMLRQALAPDIARSVGHLEPSSDRPLIYLLNAW